ncbi:hypothetical protein M422DRAFT_782529 [Sphaerobolus stellatus SS14]|uniref:Uncharacterized protein n=1 Tax=Sphaerobolus stellatus (strain SS14) TaxID=990650 RepID=A0A0C9V1H2_SPHS4|nr:hypothetical protein M422DRAFT_782529 [Sphaerobolus stellatus SS14]
MKKIQGTKMQFKWYHYHECTPAPELRAAASPDAQVTLGLRQQFHFPLTVLFYYYSGLKGGFMHSHQSDIEPCGDEESDVLQDIQGRLYCPSSNYYRETVQEVIDNCESETYDIGPAMDELEQ